MSGSACSNPTTTMAGLRPNGLQVSETKPSMKQLCSFQMPLHYPRYNKTDYETMPEWKLDSLLTEYGLPVIGDVAQKRNHRCVCITPAWSSAVEQAERWSRVVARRDA
ncbi:hypothetical protein U1Q18_021167 [Sarracenia purpurea var. burkii]